MVNHESNCLPDEEIIKSAHEEQEKAAVLGVARFGVLADAIEVLRYRIYEWWERRSAILPIHKMTHLYRNNPSLARELAVLSHARAAMTNLMSVAVLLRGGVILPIPAVFRVSHELFIDANFLRLVKSGENAVRMLDWQLVATAKINPDDLGLQENYSKMKDEYKGYEDFGEPGTWAILPNGKSGRSFGARMQYVYTALEKDMPAHILSEENWSFLKRMIGEQRAQANATMHASPIAAATVDDQIFMAVQAAIFAFLTVTAYRRVTDERINQNRDVILSKLGALPLDEDELTWAIVGTAVHGFGLAVRQTFAEVDEEEDAALLRAMLEVSIDDPDDFVSEAEVMATLRILQDSDGD